MTRNAWMFLFLFVLIVLCFTVIKLRTEIRENRKLDGIVMMRNQAGDLSFKMQSTTRMEYQDRALRFRMKDGKRVIIIQGKHGNIVQCER